MDEDSDKRIKFLNEVWPVLQEEKDYNVIRTFINKMSVMNDEYRFNGGVYPDVMFVLSMSKDEVNTLNKELEKFKEMEQSEEKLKLNKELEQSEEKPKLIKIKKKKPVVEESESESESEETKEETRQRIKKDWLDRISKKV